MEVFNSQMVYSFEVNEELVGKNYINISQPVLQRLINGTTKGLLIRPIGAIDASFYELENQKKIGMLNYIPQSRLIYN